MTDRSAIATIKGYFYQFDYTILELLNLQDDETVITIEGIEDLDLTTLESTTAVQCKYYESTEYNHSVIAKAIRFMFEDFINRKNANREIVNYKLYGYYERGQDKLVLPIELDFLKAKFLTFTEKKTQRKYHEELGVNDDLLKEFISILDIDINASEYSSQLNQIYKQLKNIFSCDDFEAEYYYYNNALNEVKKLSIESNIYNRRISKQDFLKNINKKEIIFNKWFVSLKGKQKHYKNLRKQYFSELNVEPFDRFFLIEIDQSDYNRGELISLLLFISKNYSKITKRANPKFCPFIYIHNLDAIELLETKRYLRSSGKRCTDGYEFEGGQFSENLMFEPMSPDRPLHIKFLNKIEDLETVLVSSTKIVNIFQFYLSDPFFDSIDKNAMHVKIQIEHYNDIKDII